MKIVINRCYGGFGLSKEAMLAWFAAKKMTVWYEKPRMYDQFWLVPPEERVDNTTEEFYKLPMPERTALSSKLDSQRFYEGCINRTDPDLITVVETLGKDANGAYAELKVIEIPDGVEWEIEEYDGMEWVAEVHRTWS